MRMSVKQEIKDVKIWKRKVRQRMMTLVRKDLRNQTKAGIDGNGIPFVPYKTDASHGAKKFTKKVTRKGVKTTIVKGKLYGPSVPVNLIRTGTMLKQLKKKSSMTEGSIFIKGNKQHIAMWQHNGTNAGKPYGIPARPFMGWRPTTIKIVQGYVAREIQRAFKTATLKELTTLVKSGAA